MSFPPLNELKTPLSAKNLIDEMKDKVHIAAYDLLKAVSDKFESSKSDEIPTILQIATSESLTAGLIMSSLVDLPIAGWLKYGCFGVYDTDAKRVFNSVKVDDVYTHMCAKEMAIGMLKNSNATFAIAVTGNAMPYFDHLNRLGEVFIGIASYGKPQDSGDNTILYSTTSINACMDSEEENFKRKCKSWLGAQPNSKSFAKREDTATISRLVRYYTAYAAMRESVKFIEENNNRLSTPEFIAKRKKINEEVDKQKNCIHNKIPLPKYPKNLKELCVSDETCGVDNSCDRGEYVREIPLTIQPEGGSKNKKQTKRRKRKKKKGKKMSITILLTFICNYILNSLTCRLLLKYTSPIFSPLFKFFTKQ